MKYALCEYNEKGELVKVRRFSCAGCAKKRRKPGKPFCVRKSNQFGEIVWMNDEYKKLNRKED